MSDSMIRVGRRGSNFIDANLLVFPKKKYPKIKKSARKKAVAPKGKKAKPIIVSKVNKEKRTLCLIKYSQMIADDLENQGKYKRMFYAFYPDYPKDSFKKFVNMYYAIVKNKKFKYVARLEKSCIYSRISPQKPSTSCYCSLLISCIGLKVSILIRSRYV